MGKTVYLLVKVNLDECFTEKELTNDIKNAVRSYPGSLMPMEAIDGMRKATVKLLKLNSEDSVSSGKKVQHFSSK